MGFVIIYNRSRQWILGFQAVTPKRRRQCFVLEFAITNSVHCPTEKDDDVYPE